MSNLLQSEQSPPPPPPRFIATSAASNTKNRSKLLGKGLKGMDAATLNAEWLRRYDRALELDKWGQMEEARECYKKLRDYIDSTSAPHMCVAVLR